MISGTLNPRIIKRATTPQTRLFRTTISSKMPEPLTKSEVNAGNDPSVTKQYDTETPVDKQISEFFGFVDKLKVGLLTTQRPGVGPVSRSMAVARRTGPDFLFLANKNSTKFSASSISLVPLFSVLPFQVCLWKMLRAAILDDRSMLTRGLTLVQRTLSPTRQPRSPSRTALPRIGHPSRGR